MVLEMVEGVNEGDGCCTTPLSSSEVLALILGEFLIGVSTKYNF